MGFPVVIGVHHSAASVEQAQEWKALGYRIVWTPYAELLHHESISRGLEDSPEKRERFAREALYMQEKWHDALLSDPAYNPNLSLTHEDFRFAEVSRVPKLL